MRSNRPKHAHYWPVLLQNRDYEHNTIQENKNWNIMYQTSTYNTTISDSTNKEKVNIQSWKLIYEILKLRKRSANNITAHRKQTVNILDAILLLISIFVIANIIQNFSFFFCWIYWFLFFPFSLLLAFGWNVVCSIYLWSLTFLVQISANQFLPFPFPNK